MFWNGYDFAVSQNQCADAVRTGAIAAEELNLGELGCSQASRIVPEEKLIGAAAGGHVAGPVVDLESAAPAAAQSLAVGKGDDAGGVAHVDDRRCLQGQRANAGGV